MIHEHETFHPQRARILLRFHDLELGQTPVRSVAGEYSVKDHRSGKHARRRQPRVTWNRHSRSAPLKCPVEPLQSTCATP